MGGEYLAQRPVHTGCGAPCNMRMQIMEHNVVNGSVHTGCKQHQMVYASCVNGALAWICSLCGRREAQALCPGDGLRGVPPPDL